jgi:hypothetical protein
MTPLELLAVLILAGAILVLIYYYLEGNGNRSLSRVRSVVMETSQKARSTISNNEENADDSNKGNGKVGDIMSGMNEKASGIGEKARTVVSGVGQKASKTGESVSDGSVMDSVSEKVSGVGEKLRGSVKGVPKTDNLSNKIDIFLNDKSDQLVKDWELATKDDILDIDKRYNKVKRDIGELDSRFNEYRGFTNKKIKKIEERLDKLENP